MRYRGWFFPDAPKRNWKLFPKEHIPGEYSVNDNSDDDVKINFPSFKQGQIPSQYVYHNTSEESQLYSNLPELNES